MFFDLCFPPTTFFSGCIPKSRMASQCKCVGSCTCRYATVKLSEDYEDLFLSKDHADVTFEFEGGHEVKAHKLILVTRVPLFQKMFSSGMKESQTNRVKIEDADTESFFDFLYFIYCGKLPVSPYRGNVFDLSAKYDVLDLVRHCISTLKSKMDSCSSFESEAARLFEFAKKFDLPNIKRACEDEILSLLKSCVDRCSKWPVSFLIISHVHDCPQLKKSCLSHLNEWVPDLYHIHSAHSVERRFPDGDWGEQIPRCERCMMSNCQENCFESLRSPRENGYTLRRWHLGDWGTRLKEYPELLLEMVSRL